MELTKDQALTKICPFRNSIKTAHTCQCDKCMAWTWTKWEEEIYQGVVTNQYDKTKSFGDISNGMKPVKGKCLLIDT